MKVEIDTVADAGYISFKDIAEGEVVTTISLNDDINVDLDKDKKILGIEILQVSKNLPVKELKKSSA